jgi:hypothetical protein
MLAEPFAGCIMEPGFEIGAVAANYVEIETGRFIGLLFPETAGVSLEAIHDRLGTS